MARPRKIGKKTTIGIEAGLVGWMEFAGREYAGGTTEYLNELAKADRFKFLSAPDDGTAQKYRMYLQAVGYDDELAEVDGGEV